MKRIHHIWQRIWSLVLHWAYFYGIWLRNCEYKKEKVLCHCQYLIKELLCIKLAFSIQNPHIIFNIHVYNEWKCLLSPNKGSLKINKWATSNIFRYYYCQQRNWIFSAWHISGASEPLFFSYKVVLCKE